MFTVPSPHILFRVSALSFTRERSCLLTEIMTGHYGFCPSSIIHILGTVVLSGGPGLPCAHGKQ